MARGAPTSAAAGTGPLAGRRLVRTEQLAGGPLAVETRVRGGCPCPAAAHSARNRSRFPSGTCPTLGATCLLGAWPTATAITCSRPGLPRPCPCGKPPLVVSVLGDVGCRECARRGGAGACGADPGRARRWCCTRIWAAPRSPGPCCIRRPRLPAARRQPRTCSPVPSVLPDFMLAALRQCPGDGQRRGPGHDLQRHDDRPDPASWRW